MSPKGPLLRLKSNAAAAYSGPFRISGKAQGVVRHAGASGELGTTIDLWLTVTAGKS
jgi:hypothetical protein